MLFNFISILFFVKYLPILFYIESFIITFYNKYVFKFELFNSYAFIVQ